MGEIRRHRVSRGNIEEIQERNRGDMGEIQGDLGRSYPRGGWQPRGRHRAPPARYGRDVGEMWARCGRDVGDILGEIRERHSGDTVQLGLAERLPISPLYLAIPPPYLPHISPYLPVSPLYSASVLPITGRSASLYLHHISASPGEAPQPRPPQRSPGRTAPGIESVTVVLSIAVRISLRSEAQAAQRL